MKWLRAAAEEIITGEKKAIKDLDPDQIEEFINLLIEAKDKKIIVVGVGRSGFVGRAFALRLMNLGFHVYFLGETITPSAGKDDVFISISGSGTTKIVITASTTAKEIGMTVVAVTSHKESPLAKLADHIIKVTGRTKLAQQDDYLARQLLGERESLSPLGTMFENNCMLFLDCLIVELMYRLGKTEGELMEMHATIE